MFCTHLDVNSLKTCSYAFIQRCKESFKSSTVSVHPLINLKLQGEILKLCWPLCSSKFLWKQLRCSVFGNAATYWKLSFGLTVGITHLSRNAPNLFQKASKWADLTMILSGGSDSESLKIEILMHPNCLPLPSAPKQCLLFLSILECHSTGNVQFLGNNR